MKKLLIMAVLTALFTTGVNATDTYNYEYFYNDMFSKEDKANTVKKVNEIIKVLDKSFDPIKRGSSTQAGQMGALKQLLEGCGTNINYSFTDSTGANKTVDLWAFVMNASDYVDNAIRLNDKKRVIQYFAFVTRPYEDSLKRYAKNGDLKENNYYYRAKNVQGLLKFLKTGDVRTPFEPFGVAYDYACRNNGSTDVLNGHNNKIYKDFIYKISIRDFKGVDKILDKINVRIYINQVTYI